MKHFKSYLLGLAALLFLNGCSKDDDKKASPVPSKADYYFSAKIGGKDVLYEESQAFSNGVGTNNASEKVNGMFQEAQMCGFISVATVKPVLYVSINKNFQQKPTECSQIESMYKIGTYPYSQRTTGTNSYSTEGAWILYIDANNVQWGTERGSQVGSTFELTEHIANNKDQLSEKISVFKFNCKLYDSNGNVMDLKDGQMRTHTVQCNYL